MKALFTSFVCGAALVLFLAACQGGGHRQQRATSANLERGFFLVPEPAAPLDRIQNLLIAPVTDRDLIVEVGLELEAAARTVLIERREKVVGLLCRQKPVATWVLREQLRRENQERSAGAARLDRSRRQMLARERLADSVLSSSEAALDLAGRLREERATLIQNSWERLIAAGARSPEKLCAGATQIAKKLPGERLHAPYYVALHRFYSTLPPRLRQRMIQSLHPRENGR